MEEHPNCQPGRTVAVNRGYDDDGQGNEDLESKRIDNLCLLIHLNEESLVIYHLTFFTYHFV